MKEYIMPRIFKGSAGIAQGIFVSLGIGLLIENIGRIVDIPTLITIGVVAKSLMAPAIGAGIAFMLGANGLVIFSAMVITYIVIPVAVSYILYIILKKAGRIKHGDMTVPQS